jgi:ribokinase
VSRAPTLAVIGAINVDLVVSGAPLPRAGETVVGGTFAEHQGGKGGNQAVAAARALRPNAGTAPSAHPPRQRVVMIGAVGDDQGLGVDALDTLRGDLVDTSEVVAIPEASTGVALIAVDIFGENQISVAPGANAHVSPARVIESLERHSPGVILASLEVPPDAVLAAARWANERGVTFVLNPAPAGPAVREIAMLATHVTPNVGELEPLGSLPTDVVVVQTRGADGATIHRDGELTTIPAPEMDAVDTTGAGDCFNGVFAAGLLEDREPWEAVRRAVVAAALSVRVPGAREGMPDAEQIAAALDHG